MVTIGGGCGEIPPGEIYTIPQLKVLVSTQSRLNRSTRTCVEKPLGGLLQTVRQNLAGPADVHQRVRGGRGAGEAYRKWTFFRRATPARSAGWGGTPVPKKILRILRAFNDFLPGQWSLSGARLSATGDNRPSPCASLDHLPTSAGRTELGCTPRMALKVD